jgi:hypothetical protein
MHIGMSECRVGTLRIARYDKAQVPDLYRYENDSIKPQPVSLDCSLESQTGM